MVLQQRLDTILTPTSLSAQKKQLMCLARALLKESKLLVLDEITSQQVLLNPFSTRATRGTKDVDRCLSVQDGCHFR
jgi:ABC-type phosphate transport system ATPase subunit